MQVCLGEAVIAARVERLLRREGCLHRTCLNFGARSPGFGDTTRKWSVRADPDGYKNHAKGDDEDEKDRKIERLIS